MEQIGIFFVYGFAYFAGSVNFAVIFFRLTGREDPRLSFSGNAGTTNVYRQAGWLWAAAVLLLDIGRAMAVALVAAYCLKKPLLPGGAFFLVLGNSYPCFHGFRGGKGVANYLGYTAVIAPWAALASCVVWVIVYGILRIPFMASFFMVFILAAGQIVYSDGQLEACLGALTTLGLILFNHRSNMAEYRKRFKETR